jgi:isoquinoline 1-oxidoreductase beta subunit
MRSDPCHAVNPRQIEMRVVNSFVYGIGALFQEITIKDGKAEQTNFDSYRPMSLADMPKVETIVMPSGGWWGGVGEPTIAVAAPAVLNAIANATGKRLRQMPIKQARLRA